MEGLIFILLIFMFFLGIVQVLVGLGAVFVHRDERVRKHMAYYLGGVALYFLALWALSPFDRGGPLTVYSGIFFFTGAFGLCFYQLAILYRPRNQS